MKKVKKASSNFELCDSRAFGFGELPLGNNSSAHKILEHFNRGFKSHYVRDEDCTYVESIQNNLL